MDQSPTLDPPPRTPPSRVAWLTPRRLSDDNTMAGSPATGDRVAWQRSSIGITPLTVRPRPGSRRVRKVDVLGGRNTTTEAEQEPTANDDPFKIVVPGRRRAAGDNAAGLVSPSALAGSGGRARVCSVCTRSSAMYSCPTCLIGYCSSICYKRHGSSCTEAFFKGHVERETLLREAEESDGHRGSGSCSGGAKKERRTGMVEIMKRVRRRDNAAKYKKGDANGVGSSRSAPMAEDRPQEVATDGMDDAEREQEVLERLEALALALNVQRDELHPDTASVDPSKSGIRGDLDGTSGTRGGAASVEEALRTGMRRKAERPSLVQRDEPLEAGGTGAMRRAAVGVALKDDEGMLDLLTDEEKERFLREVANGGLAKLIVPWSPWWKHSSDVQEIAAITGRRTHSLPAPAATAVPPCLEVGISSSSSSSSTSSSSLSSHSAFPVLSSTYDSPPTQPPTPEEVQPSSLTGSSNIDGSGERRLDAALSESSTATGTVVAAATAPRASQDKIGGNGQQKTVSVVDGSERTKELCRQDASTKECTRHSFSSLFNQALNSPDFSTLSARAPSPALPALAADVAYAYALTARLYNGCWCNDPVGASLALVGASLVLKDNATPATVGQALNACAERVVCAEGVGFATYAESLREDALSLCSDARKLTCAFQDAWGMLEAAGRTLAPSNPIMTDKETKKAQKKAAKELGKVEKRIGYFLLWARSYGTEMAPAITKTLEQQPVKDQSRNYCGTPAIVAL